MHDDRRGEPRSLDDIVDALRKHTDEACFACGPANPIGLRVDEFVEVDGHVEATFLARPEYQGTTGALHGGIAATALDEILVWAGILQQGVLTVTGKMEIRYRAPVQPHGGRVRVRARVDERRGRRLTISGELLAADGSAAVTASGLYLVSHTVDELVG